MPRFEKKCLFSDKFLVYYGNFLTGIHYIIIKKTMPPAKKPSQARQAANNKRRSPTRRTIYREKHIIFFLLFVCFLLTTFLGSLLIGLASLRLPDISSVARYQPAQATLIFDRHGRLIDRMYVENRTVVSLKDMNPNLPDAFVAAEDGRFYDHPGLDLFSVFRALINNLKEGGRGQGGSTITQQVAKSLLLTPEKTYIRKIREAILAWRIDKLLTKDEILFIYLNQIYLGEGAYGVEAAANTYFGKSAKNLSLAEVSLLAGLPQAPSKYSPMRHLKRAVARQKYVLNRMAADGYISAEEAQAAFEEKLSIRKKSSPKKTAYGYYLDAVKNEARELLGTDLQHAGAKIYTNLDPILQQKAARVINEGVGAYEAANQELIKKEKSNPQGALVCIENGSRKVRALVGGKDYAQSQFNRAVQAKRQVGSTFKPFVYAAAIRSGLKPESIISDDPFSIKGKNGKIWTPKNYSGRYHGDVTLKTALSHSYNAATLRLMQQVGYKEVHSIARNAGIQADLQKDLSLGLGAIDLAPFTITSAYTAFANRGVYKTPMLIDYIVTRSGKRITPERFEQRVYTTKVAAYMEQMLRAVVEEGSGRKAKNVPMIRGGKTGTSNENRDVWFVGFTDKYTTGVWLGNDRNQTLGRKATGGSIAAPIWAKFMSGL